MTLPFNEQSEQDLSDIVIGLLLWTKISITEEEALRYAEDILCGAVHS